MPVTTALPGMRDGGLAMLDGHLPRPSETDGHSLELVIFRWNGPKEGSNLNGPVSFQSETSH